MTDVDWLAVFETKAELYHRRFGRLAPGKSDPLRDANDAENQEQWEKWHNEKQWTIDALVELHRAWSEIEALKNEHQACVEALIALLDDAGVLTGAEPWEGKLVCRMLRCSLQEDHIDAALELIGSAYTGDAYTVEGDDAAQDEAEHVLADQPAVCHWHAESWEWEMWEGACGAAWCLANGGPKENNMRYCPMCGGAVYVNGKPVMDNEKEKQR